MFDTSRRGADNPVPGTPNGAWAAEVASVTARGVEVVIPDFDPTLRWGPCPFSRSTTPERGDKCLVIFDQGNDEAGPTPWVVAWA